MNLPANLKYTSDHEWIELTEEKHEGNKIARVGITDFAQKELGDIGFVEIETAGEDLEHGDIFGTIEAVKTVSDLFMPVSGKIIEVNEELESQPELVNTDPYGEGWLIKMKISDSAEISDLLDDAGYKDLIG